MKHKILILVSLIVVLVGCSLTDSGIAPKRVVEEMLGNYQSLNSEVLNQLDKVIAGENLTIAQKDDYEELMRKQYQNLTYSIKEEVIDGDTAVVTVEIEVFDYAKAIDDAEIYAAENEDKFLDKEGAASESLYQDYKIEQLKTVTDKIKYTLDLGLTKEDNKWKLDDLSDMERQKIHGLYNS
ncbi:MAG: hypothetical protein PHT75_01700 [Bacilli bacterium]|nr:hypothetical protein [Bacilli bacterium]MDD3304827.1 hypothetical protein [Bacilli bacterium]MDD4053414.1 hypothetical protein [Bacilli bacterium]MDD4410939.1 hypothetical protein [Bacilli bacterium]